MLKMDSKKYSYTWLLLIGFSITFSRVHGWGSYVCDLQEQGLKKIGEVCSESASSHERKPFSDLEDRLERVLEFVEEIKSAEDSWFQITKKSGTVERDLSKHDETDYSRHDETNHDVVDYKTRVEDRISRDRHDYKTPEITGDNRAIGDRTHQSRPEVHEDTKWRSEEDRTSGRNDYSRNWRGRSYDGEARGSRDSTDSRDQYNSGDRYDRSSDRKQRIDEREGRNVSTGYDRDSVARTTEQPARRQPDEKKSGTGLQRGECSAISMDSHETVGMFYMLSYQHGHCANRNPILQPIRYCLGYCTTKTFIDRESGVWSQGSDCKSCQPIRFETLRIPLACDDGFTFEKKFKNVVDCSCRRCKSVS